MRQRSSLALTLSVGFVLFLIACGGPTPAVLSVTLAEEALTLEIGDSHPLVATVVAVGGASQEVGWSSSDETVATVSGAGLVTAVDVGEATVTATSAADPGKHDGVAITVVDSSAMVLTVDTSVSPGTTVTLPLRGDVDLTVRWGDGHVSAATDSGDLSHTYDADGSYTIMLSGSLTQFGNDFEGYEHGDKITGVTAWGDLGLTSLAGAFWNAVHLTAVPADFPTTVTDAANLFFGAVAFDQDIGEWDVTRVTNMHAMFYGATSFDQDISAWNTASATTTSYMFYATGFDQDIGGWDVGNVTNMRLMFGSNAAFDQDIGGWDVSNVTIMHGLFAQATAFNQDIGGWDVANVTDMSYMFFLAGAFDQDIGGWGVANVTNMDRMFNYATGFDQDLSGWCVANIAAEPTEFAVGATAWLQPKPVWGTCP